MKACQRNWAEVFGDEANMFAVSPSNSYQKVRASLSFVCFVHQFTPDAFFKYVKLC